VLKLYKPVTSNHQTQSEVPRSDPGRISNVIGEFLWEVNAGGYYTYVSPSVRGVLGYEPEELLGHHYMDFLEAANQEAVARTAGETFAAGAEIESLLNVLNTKDGRHVTVLTSGRPIFSEDGTFLGYRGSDRDVTGVLHMACETERYKTIIEQANFGVALADANFVITYANSAFARDHGYEPDEMVGQPIAFLHSPGQMERANALVDRIASAGGFLGEEVWHLRKNGTEFPMLMTGILLKEPDGERTFAATAIDITDRKQAELDLVQAKEMAEQSDRTKSEFLAMVSHEFRTPLNHITGFGALVAASVGDPELENLAALVQKSADEFLQMVNDLIEIAGSPATKIQARRETFRLSEFIQNVEQAVGLLLRESGKEERVHLKPFDSHLLRDDVRLGDARRLRLLLEPLIKNAVKFTSLGSISLSCEERGPGLVSFLLQDTGCGIPSENMPGIFEPFGLAHAGSTRPHGGMGIGLPLARKIASILAAEINLQSPETGGFLVEVIVPLGEAVSATGQ
jgi:PAS domain S-box-containing protein